MLRAPASDALLALYAVPVLIRSATPRCVQMAEATAVEEMQLTNA
eukprot:COSAG03_NODE_22751_length_287_cov_1.021277_1_plen_44_part_01